MTRAILLTALAAVALTGCNSTKIFRSEMLESIGPVDPTGMTVAVMASGTSEANVAEVEEAVAARISEGKATGVAAHTIVPAGASHEQLARALSDAGVDALVFLRLTGTTDTQVSREEPQFYGSLSSYYDTAWQTNPHYVSTRTYTTYEVEVVCYRVSDGKPFWKANTETFAPNSKKDFANGMTKAVAKTMRDQGLIAE